MTVDDFFLLVTDLVPATRPCLEGDVVAVRSTNALDIQFHVEEIANWNQDEARDCIMGRLVNARAVFGVVFERRTP